MKSEVYRPEILIHPTLKKEIADELQCSTQTVMMAVRYVTYSRLSKAIREKAKQKLTEEASKVCPI